MDEWKGSGARAQLEVRYSLPGGHFPMATWMAIEFWSEFQDELAITLTPTGEEGVEIRFNNQAIFDKIAEGKSYPGLDKIRELKALIHAKLHPTTLISRRRVKGRLTGWGATALSLLIGR